MLAEITKTNKYLQANRYSLAVFLCVFIYNEHIMNKNRLGIHFTKKDLWWRNKYSNDCRKRLLGKQTRAEDILYPLLKTHMKGISKIQKQKVIFTPKSFIIADFFLKGKKTVIEVDGSIHETKEQQIIDDHKDAIYKKSGFRVFRVRNEDVIPDPQIAIDKIMKFVCGSTNARPKRHLH